MLSLLFWTSAGLLAFTYLGYPLSLEALTRLRPRKSAAPAHEPAHEPAGAPAGERMPSVALVIAAWNEAGVIKAKLENTRALDYPSDRLKVVVASDGSQDATVSIARSFEGNGVTVLDLPRGGKTQALERAMQWLQTEAPEVEVVVFSDANVFLEPDALQKLVRHFADPQLGGVSADVRLRPEGFSLGASQGLYYQYERWIQRLESQVGSIIGADGGLYGIRRALYRSVDRRLINDDFVLSMGVVRQGFRLIYDPEVVAYEDSPVDASNELRRKIRVEHGNFQALFAGVAMPNADQPLARYCFVGHKVLRWVGFVPLTVLLGSSLGLASGGGIPALAAAGQGLFYLLAGLGWAFEGKGGPALKVPFYFTMENWAAARGLIRHFTGETQWGTAATRTRSV
ncbi:MAG: glycosyltransferase family 2 protein [Myxococcota bacterium]